MGWSNAEKERERLGAMYREMSDAELLKMHGSAGDLTEVAQEALAGEMKRRGIEVAPEEEMDGAAGFESFKDDEISGWKTLHVFHQTFEAEAAFRLMEGEAIEFAVEDRTVDERGEVVAGPAVALALMVAGADWSRSVSLLRREAGLFPEAVVDPRGEEEAGEEEMVSVGEFEEGDDLREAVDALERAGIGVRTTRHDGEEWERTSVEVKGEDQDRALAVLERLLEEDARRL